MIEQFNKCTDFGPSDILKKVIYWTYRAVKCIVWRGSSDHLSKEKFGSIEVSCDNYYFSHNFTQAKVSMNSIYVALTRVKNSRDIRTLSEENCFNIVRLKYPIYLQEWLKTNPFD